MATRQEEEADVHGDDPLIFEAPCDVQQFMSLSIGHGSDNPEVFKVETTQDQLHCNPLIGITPPHGEIVFELTMKPLLDIPTRNDRLNVFMAESDPDVDVKQFWEDMKREEILVVTLQPTNDQEPADSEQHVCEPQIPHIHLMSIPIKYVDASEMETDSDLESEEKEGQNDEANHGDSKAEKEQEDGKGDEAGAGQMTEIDAENEKKEKDQDQNNTGKQCKEEFESSQHIVSTEP